MARKLILENLMKLASSIGANPKNFMGTRSNITFLGKGPQRNPLFQRPVPGLEEHVTSITLQGQRGAALDKSMISAVEDAMGFATAGKLNDIQLKALTINLESLNKGLNPALATVTKFPERGSGITGLGRRHYTQEDIKLARDYARKSQEGAESLEKQFGYGKYKSALPEPGPGDVEFVKRAMDMETGLSRAIARNLLLKDTRLKLKPEDLFMLKEGKGEPLELMRKYYGESMLKYDDFLNNVNIHAARPDEFAEMILKHVKLTPQFARGGLARILEV